MTYNRKYRQIKRENVLIQKLQAYVLTPIQTLIPVAKNKFTPIQTPTPATLTQTLGATLTLVLTPVVSSQIMFDMESWTDSTSLDSQL